MNEERETQRERHKERERERETERQIEASLTLIRKINVWNNHTINMGKQCMCNYFNLNFFYMFNAFFNKGA